MRISRCAAPVVACVVAALAVPAAGMASAAVRGSGPTEHVLLTLAPQDRGALRALALGVTPRGVSRASALAEALPAVGRQQSVAAIARSLGLTVDHTGRMSVLVSGRASLVQQLFGSARSVNPQSPVQQPLPTLPGALRGSVTVALGGDDKRPAFHATTAPPATGQEFRTAYGVDPIATNPVSPAPPGGSPLRQETIATVQLSGWHPSDLTTYARRLGSAWPTPKYKSVLTDPSIPPTIDQFGDDVEVDLDQESIYSVAPYANQRAYLTDNSDTGMYESLSAIGDDASDPTVDRHIVAASISWGFCESDLNSDPAAHSLYSAFEDVLSYDLATGVTVFAATGDNGSYCDPGDGSRRAAVKGVGYPASSAQVVAVGGTQHAGAVTDGTPQGWVTSWNDASHRGAASEGGASSVFPRPAYQNAANTGSAMRTVPDISALAGDPGFALWTSTPSDPPAHAEIDGGTSLASPVTTATFAVQLALDGTSWGVGDILPGLYREQGYGGATPAYTDVDDGCVAADHTCAGWNGAGVAGTGYDQVTGLGTPVWQNLLTASLGGDPHLRVKLENLPVAGYSRSLNVPIAVQMPSFMSFEHYRVDVDSDHVCMTDHGSSTPPTTVRIDDGGFKGAADGTHDLTLVAWNDPPTDEDPNNVVCHYSDAFVAVDTSAPLPTAKLSIGKGKKDVVANWSAFDFDGSGIASYVVQVSYPGHTVFRATTSRGGSRTFAAKPGKAYTMTLTVTDRVGNSAGTEAKLLDDRAFSRPSGWTRSSAAAAFDRTLSTASRRGAKATAHVVGYDYHLYVTTCASCGKLAVYVDGKHKHIVDTYSKSTHERVRFNVFTGSLTQKRTIAVQALGSRNKHSSGDRILLDGLSTSG